MSYFRESWADTTIEDVIELQESSIVLRNEPFESEFPCDLRERSYTFLAPGIKVSRPYHRSDMTLYGELH